MTVLSKRQQKRITQSVLWTERQSRGDAKNPQTLPGDIRAFPILCVTQQAIAQNASGTARVVAGDVSGSMSSSSFDDFTVYNIGPALSNGTKVLAHWVTLRRTVASPLVGTWVVGMGQGSTTPPPPGSGFDWQFFEVVDRWFWYGSSSIQTPFINLWGGNVEGNQAFTIWKSINVLGDPDEFGGGNAALFTQTGKTLGDARNGNLQVITAGNYLFRAEVYYKPFRNSLAPTMPDPPQQFFADLKIRVGADSSTTEYKLDSVPFVTADNAYVGGSQNGPDHGLGGQCFIDMRDALDPGNDANRRLSLIVELSHDVTDLGLTLTTARLTIIKLP